MAKFIRPHGFHEAMEALRSITPNQVVVFGIDKLVPERYGVSNMDWAVEHKTELRAIVVHMQRNNRVLVVKRRRISPTMPSVAIYEDVAIGLSPAAQRFLLWISQLTPEEAKAFAC